MHVLCAVGIYGLWWHKAMDIRYPVVLRLKEELAARIYFSFDGARDGDTRGRNNAAKASQASDVGNRPEDGISDTPPDLENQTHAPRAEDSKLPSTDTTSYEGVQKAAQYPTRLDVNRFLPRLNFTKEKFHLFSPHGWRCSFRLWPPSSGELGVTEARFRCFCRDDSPFGLDLGDVGLGREEKKCKPLCVRARMTVRKGSVLSGAADGLSYLSLIAFSMVYGGAHAAAWNTHFPSDVELLLWRISSAALAASIPVGFCLFLLIERVDHAMSKSSGGGRVVMCQLLFIVLVFAMILLVLLGRGFLVVESFISLRSLKKGSFDVVPWSNYWPHF